jgi:PTH1 family peptidyl-tRNA hydrolase
MYIVVGLGNPGTEYENTRHNAGRMAADFISNNLSKADSEVKVVAIDSFMNRSGNAVAKFIKSEKAASKLIVIYDDLDLPLGSIRVSYDRGSGGHRGIESIVKALGTAKFIRIRIGVTPTTPGGKLKKPKGEKEVEKFILTDFKKSEMEILKKEVFKRVDSAVSAIARDGLARAMTNFNN